MMHWSARALENWTDPDRKRELSDAYAPIVRGFLLAGSLYYALVTWGYFHDETGRNLLILASASALASLSYWVIRTYVVSARKTTLAVLEWSGLTANLLMYANTLIYMLLHMQPAKLIYFSLMAVVFSMSGVTLRTTLFSICLSLATLYILAREAPPEVFSQYFWIGVASAFAAFGMATLLRKAILKQIDARLLADHLAAKAQALADTDSLTGVPNRRAVFNHLERLVAQKQSFWLGIFDLDGFKSINDVYGHVAGDKLLCAIVARAHELNFPGSSFGRLAGDEFVVLMPGLLADIEVERLGNLAIKTVSAPYTIDQRQLTVGASAGFAHFPSMGASSEELYEKADFALYRAKAQRRGRCVLFDATEARGMKQESALERALRESDLEQELYLLFQPQFSVREGRITGFEALARWQNPSLGLVPPDRFIRAAERAGIISKITCILFRKGIDALARWPERLTLSFNLSALDIADRSFVMSLLDEARKHGIAMRRIEFEITETAVMSDLIAARALLTTLRTAGCKIALDDFGSGYSSFQYIDELPLDKVKIDKSFVRKVTDSAASREIVAALIALCEKLRLRCVLEGVESEQEMAVLAPLLPDLIQGYLFSKPLRASEALAAAEYSDDVQAMEPQRKRA